MKFLVFIFLILIIINSVNAEINIFKKEFFIGETFQAELSFLNLVDKIEINNIKILNKLNETSNIGVILKQINKENYFIYFDVPEVDQGKYKLVVNNVKYIENNILKKENFESNFEISRREENIISINPPLIVFNAYEKNFFKVDLTNKGNNLVNVNLIDNNNITNIITNNISINKNSVDSIYFTINNKIDKNEINLSLVYDNYSYILPVYINNKAIAENNVSFFLENNNKKSYINEYKIDIPFGSYTQADIYLENNENNISNLTLSVNGNVKNILKLGFDSIPFLENKKSIILNLYTDKNIEPGYYSGNLLINNKDTEVSLPLYITVSEKANNEVKENIKIINTSEEITKSIENTTIPKTENKINKKLLSYLLISLVVIIFIIIYIIFFKKANKNKSKEYENLF